MKSRLLTAVVFALAVGFALPAQADRSLPRVEVVVTPPGASGARSLWNSEVLSFIPRVGDLVMWNPRFPQEEVVEVRWGPLQENRSSKVMVLIILESAEGCCDDWTSQRNRP